MNTEIAEILTYTNKGSAFEIWQTDGDARKKVFPDFDENKKIISLSNLVSQSNQVLAIVAKDKSATSGELISIDLYNAQIKSIRKEFVLPLKWLVSPDGKTIAYIKFSNLEENYGYTLYTESLSGENRRNLTNSETEINSFAWNIQGDAILYSVMSGNNAELNRIDLVDKEKSQIKIYENKIIDWISSTNNKIILSTRSFNGKSSKIIEIDTNGQNEKEIAEISGGIANFVYLKNNNLAYIAAQYKDKVDNNTTGQIYIVRLDKDLIKPIQKGNQVLGWQ